MEEEARAPAGCRGEREPRGWGGCFWRIRAGRRRLLHCKPGLCPARGAWGKGGIPALSWETPHPNRPGSRRCEEPVSGQQPWRSPLLPASRPGPGRTLASIFPTPLEQAGVPRALAGCGHCVSAHSLATLSTWTPVLPLPPGPSGRTSVSVHLSPAGPHGPCAACQAGGAMLTPPRPCLTPLHAPPAALAKPSCALSPLSGKR